jgi:multicomponent Na+:H+ antiporter subunit B
VPHDTVMVRTVARLLAPVIHLYALYVIFHGHYSPGGGFQGGTVIAASYILLGLALGREELERHVSEPVLIALSGLGVAIFALVGALAFAFGERFLDYSALTFLSSDPAYRRSLGILLVEIGVGMTVAAVILLIYMRLSDEGET